jgi:hypothetical protein
MIPATNRPRPTPHTARPLWPALNTVIPGIRYKTIKLTQTFDSLQDIIVMKIYL